MRHSSPTDDRWDLDERSIEALVRGHPVDESLEPLVAFARLLRLAAKPPAPEPSEELALILRGDAPAVLPRAGEPVARAGRRRRGAAIAARAAGLGAVAKVALGASLAAAGVTAAGVAGAAGVLPGAAGEAVRDAMDAVSPIDLPSDDHDPQPDNGPGHAPGAEPDRTADDDREQPTNLGDQVSDDATGRSDGEHGVDGPTIAEETPGADHRPDSSDTPGPGTAGRDRPGAAGPHTPAAPGPTTATPADRGRRDT